MGGEYFMSGLSSYSPLAGRDPFRPLTGFEGVPGFSGPGLLPLLMNVVGSGVLSGMMQGVGMRPAGLLHDQNVYDVIQNRWFTEAYRKSMGDAVEADRATYLRFGRGLAAMSGTPWGFAQRQAADNVAGLLAGGAPILAEAAPELLDSLGGSRGSAAVLTHRMAMGGRYRFDPVTGMFDPSGVGGGAALARPLYDRLYNVPDPGMRGFTAGQTGASFEQLAMRGLLPSSAGSLDAFKGGALDPGVADRLKSLDVEGVKKTLKGYAEALSAVRDLFGDMGRPDAPMGQLFQAMEALTNRSLGQVGPDKLASMVRQTRELSKLTGVGIDSATLIQQHASERGAALGLAAPFGVLAMQGSMAFGGAYRASGAASYNVWGRHDVDQMTQADANLRQQASASRIAYQMATAVRASEMVGGFAANSEAAAYVAAVKAGDTTFNGKSLAMGAEEFARMMAGAPTAAGGPSGLTADRVYAMLGQTDANQKYVFRHDIGDTARRMQGPVDYAPHLKSLYASVLRGQLAPRLGAAAATEAGRKAADAIVDRLMGSSRDQFYDPVARDRIMSEATGGVVDVTTADYAYAEVNRLIKTGRYSGIGNQQNGFELFSRDNLEKQRLTAAQARDQGVIADALAPLNRGGLMRRAVQAVMDAKPGDGAPLQRALSEALGGVSDKNVREAMQTALSGVSSEVQGLRAAQERVRSMPAGPGRDAAEAEVQRKLRDLRSRAAVVLKEQDKLGADPGILRSDVDSVSSALGSAAAITRDVAGVRYGVSDVTDAELASGREAYSKWAKGAAAQLRRQASGASGAERERLDKAAAEMDGAAASPDDAYGLAFAMRAKDEAEFARMNPAQRLERLRAVRKGWSEFWKSNRGGAARTAVEEAQSSFEGLITQGVTNEGLRQFGPDAVRRFREGRESVNELGDLAMKYSRGDVARLMMGDTEINTATPEGRAEFSRVQARVAALRTRQALIARSYSEPGWGADDSASARALLGKDAGDANKVAATARNIGVYRRLTPTELQAVEAYQRGDRSRQAEVEAAASRLKALGVDAGGAAGLVGSLGVGDLLRGQSGSLSELGLGPAEKVVEDVFSAAGLADLGESRAGQVAAGSVRTQAEKSRAARIGGAFRSVREAASRRAGFADGDPAAKMSELVAAFGALEFAPSRLRAEQERRLRAEYGIGSDEDFQKLQSAAGFLSSSGAAKALRGGRDERASALEDAISGSAQGPVEIKGTLTLDLDSGTAGIQGAMTGMRDATVRS